MNVVSIRALLEYDRLPCFETLRADHNLELHDDSKAVAFISHTWLGDSHPDPGGCFFQLLRDVLTRGGLTHLRGSTDYRSCQHLAQRSVLTQLNGSPKTSVNTAVNTVLTHAPL